VRTLQESIIGRKGSPKLNIIPIPGTITLKYERDDGNWDYKDRCDGWFMIIDPEYRMFILWSAKATYYPYIYAAGWGGIPDWDFGIYDNYEWCVLEGEPGIKTPMEMYNIITTSEFDGYAMGAICNVKVDVPDKVRDVIDKQLGI